MVSINSRDTAGIRMLQKEEVEVSAAGKHVTPLNWLRIWSPAQLSHFVFPPPGGAVDLKRGPSRTVIG